MATSCIQRNRQGRLGVFLHLLICHWKERSYMFSSKVKDDKWPLFNRGVRCLQLPHIFQWEKARFCEAVNAWQLRVLLSVLKAAKIVWLNKFWTFDLLRAEKIASGVWINMFAMTTKHFTNILCALFLSTACRVIHETVRKPQWSQLRTYLPLPSHPALCYFVKEEIWLIWHDIFFANPWWLFLVSWLLPRCL